MKQNCMIFIFLFLFSSPLIAQKAFEGVLTYEAGDMLRSVSDVPEDWMSDIFEAYKVYIKGDKIIVKVAYADAGMPNEEEFMLYEYIELKRKKYYKIAEPANFDSLKISNYLKNPKIKIIEEKRLKKIQPKIKEVSLIQADTTTSNNEAASLYRVVFDCEDCFSHIWVAKEKGIKIKHYPPIFYVASGFVGGASDSAIDAIKNAVEQEGFYFTNFSSHFEDIILEVHVSLESIYKELHRRDSQHQRQEAYNVLRLISIEEKELPDSLFELDLE
ncbi:MAG: hypothetical protein JJT94_07595 [Bernardetiaceae bacterium]|nr:hypothetical protein [Bernardetiaceae bacterium]